MPRKAALALDPLAALAAKAGPKAPRPDARGDRETILLEEPEVAAAAEKLLAALHVAKVAEGHKAAALAVVVPCLRRRVVDRWAADGRKGENPRVVCQAGSFNFLAVNACSKFRLKGRADGGPPTMAEHLRACGVPDDVAELLAERGEYTEETALSIDVQAVRKERPDVADRLLALLAAAMRPGGVSDADGKTHRLSTADVALLVQREERVAIADGFLDRAPAHARALGLGEEGAAEILDALLTAVPPQWQVGQPVCADPDAAALGLLRRPGAG